MIKVILSPLFFIMVAVVGIQIHAVVKAARGKTTCGHAILTLVCMLILGMCSMSVFNRLIYAVVEGGVSDKIACPVDVVMVLGGGYYPGGNDTDDFLNDESIARVKRGAEIYRDCGARYFVVSGSANKGRHDRNCTLMAEIAKGLNVPESAMVLEADSRVTRDHPLFLEKLNIVDTEARIAVVTSPWHVKRAMREFERVFPHAVGVAAYQASYAKGTPIGVLDWMPMAMALERTTRPIHEIIGMVWYRIANVIQDLFGIDLDRYRK